MHCCYEAGPTGYALQRQLRAWGVSCTVIAPSLTPVKPGMRIKTDRRDARQLAKYFRNGELTEVHPPSETDEVCAIYAATTCESICCGHASDCRSSCCGDTASIG